MSARAGLVAMAMLLGCPQKPDPHPPDDDGGSATTPEPTRAPTCGGAATMLADPSRSLPHGATMVALIELGDPTIAEALAQISDHARDEHTALPVRSAFSIAQWSWEVPLVQQALQRQGFVAGELAAVHMDAVPPLWIMPLGCSLAEALAVLEHDAQLSVRDLGEAAIASPVAGSTFAFDVLLHRDAIALVAAGKGREALAAWRDPAPDTGLPAPKAGGVVAKIERAPIRMLLRPSGLVAPDAASTNAVERRYRVTATGVVAIDDA
ncbi:MAG TPA: hypothetical protein VG755_36750 [Nannocystaceae bacterium]|nr:hypothetical protein [Nannocystaceae bacterium]